MLHVFEMLHPKCIKYLQVDFALNTAEQFRTKLYFFLIVEFLAGFEGQLTT
jgi:hypothetical protein